MKTLGKPLYGVNSVQERRVISRYTTEYEMTRHRTENVQISGGKRISVLVAGVALYHLEIGRVIHAVSAHVEYRQARSVSR